ncbi:MAG: tRNA (cytidine(34)-2'-O)-methyltransferase [Verrucomicrobiae bacterium]|nr:tRNA (cytidine(34)-2'-O)-methyltransferase [Verrucomicrobiae bacterium]
MKIPTSRSAGDRRPSSDALPTPPPFHVVLVEPEIPANTGTIVRLCAATRSALHLVHPLGFRLDDAALRRAGMDYLDLAVIREHRSLAEALPPGASAWFFSTKATRTLWEAKFASGDFLVFGRETKGLPEDLLARHPDRGLCIPMLEPKARSLNLALSAGIVLYEALRQTRAATGNRVSSNPGTCYALLP